MALFQKKSDPIQERSRALEAEISALESRIKRLQEQAATGAGPRLRSSVYPGAKLRVQTSDPVFEEVAQKKLTESPEPASTPEHFNDLGVRKFDLRAVLSRFQNQVSARPMTNPKLINYLAAGSIQGLRPLRYEKRVARNRCIALMGVLAVFCLGLIFYWRARQP